MSRRLTMRDIAKVAGVSQAAVSYALRNHPRISLETRQKIHSLARKLGYRPDPMLSAMAVYRQSIKLSKYRGTLAWLENHPTRDGCKEVQGFAEFFRGASERAKELGYNLETFWMCEPALTSHRLTSILTARNIQGLLIAPLPRGRGRLQLAWEHFSVVAVGHSLVQPQFHVVAGHQYLAMITIMRKLRALGYRRIGFVSTRRHIEGTAYNYVGAFLVEQERFKPQDRIPMLFVKESLLLNEKEFLRWYKQYQPQAIVTTMAEVLEILKKARQRIPKNVGVAIANMPFHEKDFSGMNMNACLIGRTATDFLVSMIHRNEKGIPQIPQRLSVEGIWVRGKTVRRVN